MKLLIVIPALNEEDSIESIIQRSLKARENIIRRSGIDDVLITVVSDGSTDRTVELASKYTDKISLIVFKKNRGYGAAIKEGWNRSDAELLGFLDADGTCDPEFFADLCKTIIDHNADIALGCRLNSKSKMPLIRRIGNVLYALLLTAFSSKKVRDTASGMRVVRRSSLAKIMPLPNGLHFTPAMSARALLSPDLEIVEIDMAYEEREGESKLHVWKDGLRFLRVIVETAFLYRPARILWFFSLLCFLYSGFLMVKPVLYYVQNGYFEGWMIYRVLTASFSAFTALLLLSTGYIAAKIVMLTVSGHVPVERHRWWLRKCFSNRYFWLVPSFFAGLGIYVIFPALLEYLETGHIFHHWSRFIVMSVLFSAAIILTVTKLIDYILNLIAVRMTYLRYKT